VTKLPSQVSAVSPLGAAIDGAPVRRPRKPRSAPVLREVTSGIVCFCGERFGESQALEFMLHLRAELGETLKWVAERKQYQRERQLRPARREYMRTYQREYQRSRRANLTTEQRAKELERNREADRRRRARRKLED